MARSSGRSGGRVKRKHNVSQGRIDYCEHRQMLLPVNSVEGKQQLNDQTHYSTLQMKGSRAFWCRVHKLQGHGARAFTLMH